MPGHSRQGNLDLPLVQTLAGDLRQDLDRARVFARVRHLKSDVTISPAAALVLAPDQALGQAHGRYPLVRYQTPLLTSPVSRDLTGPSGAPAPWTGSAGRTWQAASASRSQQGWPRQSVLARRAGR
jgi:hypothetical protein